MGEKDEARCPVCGLGVVADVMYDAGARRDDGRPIQTADTHQITTYSCGHVVPGPSLATADTRELDVEERTSEETATPPPEPPE